MSTAPVRLLTVDDFLAMPEDDSTRHELIEGELFVAAAPGWDHVMVLRSLNRLFDAAATVTMAGEVIQSPANVILSPRSVPQPDLFFIRANRVRELAVHAGVNGSPDLALEVISPSSVQMDTVVKFNLYARHGIPEYWLVNPATRSIVLYTLADGRYEPVPPDDAGLLRSGVLPGLAIDPSEVIAGLLDELQH